ncbi:hypothetical protein IW145_003236, partial [Coemansia sp. RSA 521]
LEDHSVDNRGDVGSWVRKQSLQSLARIFAADSQTFQRLNERDGELAIRLLGQILCSTTEKIDRLRVAAGHMLEILLYEQRVEAADSRLCEGLEQLRRLVPAQPNDSSGDAGVDGCEFSWADPEAAFTRIVQALSVSDEQLRRPLFEGLVSTGSAEPLIRQTAADHLFSALCIHGVVDVGDDGDEIGRLVSETEWAQESAGVKDARAQLTALVRPRLAQDRN